MVWWSPKGTHSLIYNSFPHFLLWVETYISDNFFCVSFPQMPLLCLSFCLSPTPFCGIFPSAHLSISPEGFHGFLRAISSQSDPGSDKYSLQRPFTGNEPISGFSSHSLLAGNLTCQNKMNESTSLSLFLCISVQSSSVLHSNGNATHISLSISVTEIDR